MTPLDCASLQPVIERLAADGQATAAERAHLAGCPGCRASLALAIRLERVLAEWPTSAPSSAFAGGLVERTRREAWRREQVVDWSFNLAIAAGLLVVGLGVAALAWMLGAAAGPAASAELLVEAAGALLARLQPQATVMATATLLLATTLGAWWWAEARGRWS